MNRDRSVTLLETSLSLLLLLVVLGAVFSALNVAYHTERSGREREAAARAAARVLWELRAAPARSLVRGVNLPAYAFPVPVNTAAGPTFLVPASPSFEPPNPAAPERAGHVSVIEDPDGDGSVDLLELRAVVAWKCARGEDERLVLITRRTE
ncbi:MAG: hypothetical protein D6731_12960 [Planctomycetota bacterium]|nr:MAG: hypothetical protein D6731_12960 [Planctomycetota bacterium]